MNPWDKDVVQPSEPQQPSIPAEVVSTPAPVAPAPWDKDTVSLTAEQDALMRQDIAAAMEANYVSPLESAWVSTKRSLFPTAGGLTAAGIGARLGAPFGPIGVGVGAATLGGIGAIFSDKVQEGLNPITEEQQRILNANPRAAIFGGLIPQIATSTITPVQNVRGLAQLGKAAVGAGPMTDLAKSTGINMATNVGVGMGAQYATQGEITPGHTALNVGLGTLLGRPNVAGSIPFNTGYGLTNKTLVAANKLRQNVFPQQYTSDVPLDFEVVNQPIANGARPTEIPMPPNANPKVWSSLTPEGKAAYAADLASGRWNQPAIGSEATPVVEQPPTPAPIKPAPVVEQPAVPAPVKPAPAAETPAPAPVLPSRPTSQTEIPGTEDAFNLAGQEAAAPPAPKTTETTPELVPPTEEAWVGPARKRLADLEAQGQDKGTEAAALRTLIDNAGKPATPVTQEAPVTPAATAAAPAKPAAETPATPPPLAVATPAPVAKASPTPTPEPPGGRVVTERTLEQRKQAKEDDDSWDWDSPGQESTDAAGNKMRRGVFWEAGDAVDVSGTKATPVSEATPTPATPAKEPSSNLVVVIGKDRYPVGSLREATVKWMSVVRKIESEGGSLNDPEYAGIYAMGGPRVEDASGNFVGKIADNGNIFDTPKNTVKTKLLYGPTERDFDAAGYGNKPIEVGGKAEPVEPVMPAVSKEETIPKATQTPSAKAVETKPKTLTTTTDDLILTRIGEQSESGNYYGIEGQTQYEGGQRHVLPKGSKVADLRNPATADAVINEALKDTNLTPSQRTVLEEALGQGDIDYTIFDETPMADAARRLGYDAVRVVENQDMPGTASSVFVLNNKALRPSKKTATPLNRREAGAKKAWETRRNKSARVERDFGKTFDETNETPPNQRVDEPSDVLDARARILESTKGGRSLDRGSKDVAIVNQYEADRHIALGNHQPEYLRVASDEALREYVDQVYFAQQQAAESGEAPPSAEDIRKADAIQRALDDRNAVQQELGSGNADATPTAVLDAAVSAVAATGKKLPLYPPEFEGSKTWRALYESLPTDVRDKLFNNFRGQLDLARMRDPVLGPSYRSEIALKAEADASDLWSAIAENGNPAFDLGKNNMDVGMEALRNAGFGADEAPVGNVPRLYNAGGKGETPFGFAPLTAPGVLSGMDLAQTGLTAVLASDKSVPGLNPISANMHLLADGRGFGLLYAGTPERFVPSKTMKSVAEMFLIRGGRTEEGAQETFYGQRDAERRRMTSKLFAAFDPVAKKLDSMTEAQLGRFDTEMARMLSGEAPIDPNTPEGKVAIAIKKLSDEAHAYATEAGLEIGYAKDYGMPHSINASAVDKNQTGFLEAATRAYAINNPKRIAALTNKLNVAKPEEAVKIQAEIDFLNNAKPSEQAQAWLDNILNGAEGADRRMGLLLDGGAQATNTANFTNERVFVPEARAVLREFYNNNPIVAWRRYIDRVATMAEFSRRFGPSGEKWTKMVEQMRKEGASETQIQLFKEHVKDSLGSLNPRPSSGHALANSALSLSNMSKLSLTAAANFLESMAPATRGQFSSLITGPLRMARNTLDLVAEMTPAEAQSFREALGREASTPNGSIQLARAVGLIDAAGVHEILNNSAHMIDSDADYQGSARGGSGDRLVLGTARVGHMAASGLARAYGIEVTENAKRADAARAAANRLDGFADGVLDDGILARAYAVAKPNAKSNPFSIRNESIIRLRRAGISDAQMNDFAKAWRSHRDAGDLESWIASDDPMAALARKAVRLEAGQASVSSDRSFGTGGKEGALISQDHLFGKLVMTYMRYPSAALQQIFKPMAQDVSAGAKGSSEGVDFSPYSRVRMGMQVLGLPMMATAAAAYLLMRDMINGYNDKTIWQRIVEGFGYTGAFGGKAEMVNKAFRGEIPSGISESVQIMKDINRAEKGQGQRVLVNNAIKSIGKPLTQGAIVLAVPNPMAAVLVRMVGTKYAREMATNAIMEPKPKADTRGSGRR